MNIKNIDKICFDGVNLLTASGIFKMCQDSNEFDSFYSHSVLNNLAGVMQYSRMFFMNASERVYLLVKILKQEGIDDICDQGSRSLPRWTELRPPYSPSYSRFSNRFVMPASMYYEKRETFLGLFALRKEQQGKDEKTLQYRLQATNLSYVAGQKVSAEFYCRIESHFIEENEMGDRAPKSILSYLNPYQLKDRLFFLEQDILTLMKLENIQYNEIPVDLFYADGKEIEIKEEIKTETAGTSLASSEDENITSSPEKVVTVDLVATTGESIPREEYILLCFLYLIVEEALSSDTPRFKTINQLYHYPHEKYPTLKGISESSVRLKIKKARQVFALKHPALSETPINTRTEKTLHNMLGILLDSIINGLQANFNDEKAFVDTVFKDDELSQNPELEPSIVLDTLLDIMNDFNFLTKKNEAVSICAQ